MGFLDFLKKNKPADEKKVDSLPPPDSAPVTQPVSHDELFAPPSHLTPPIDPETEKDAVTHAAPEEWSVDSTGSPEPPKPVMEKPASVASDPGMYEDVPLPPVEMQDPGFMDATSEDENSPFQNDSVTEDPFQMPEESKEPSSKPKVADIDLPDFTDEDFAEFDEQEPPQVEAREEIPEQETPVEKMQVEKPAKEESVQPESLPDLPDAQPESPDDVPPLDSPSQFGKLEPAKFLSSNTYFDVDEAIKSSRKSLRAADNAILDALSYHEHGDEKLQDFAITVNEVQEHLMDLDAALFED